MHTIIRLIPHTKLRFLLFGVLILSLGVTNLPAQKSGSITLLGQLSLPDSIAAQDLWGYFEPTTGDEYAVVGYVSKRNFPEGGFVLVKVTDPSNPVQVVQVPSGSGFDVKVWQSYVYTVNGRGAGTGEIVDITDIESPRIVGSFPSAHNIFIAENGYMYLEMPGLRIFDLNADPLNPRLVWSGGDQQEGHDATVIDNILFDFHGRNVTNIYDVTDPSNPTLLGAISAPFIRYHHCGWPTEDGRFLFLSDELAANTQNNLDRPDLSIWDIRDFSNPELVARFTDPSARIHNLYIINDYAYVSYYAAGFRVFDVSDVSKIVLVDEFDTSPSISGRAIFGGAFGVYPFAPSGNIYVSDTRNGLFVFAFSEQPTSVNRGDNGLPDQFVLFQNHPNPFNPETTISYQLPKRAHVKLEIYNLLGQHLVTLVDETRPPGVHSVKWFGRDASGVDMASGLYVYRLETSNFVDHRKMLYLK